MSQAYSLDLRERVLSFLEKGQDTKVASQLFEVSQRTVQRWVKQKRETGDIKPRQRKFAYRKIDYDQLRRHVEMYPDQFLYEVAEKFSVTLQAIFYAFKKLKITRKKNNTLQREKRRKKKAISRTAKRYP